MLQKKRERSTKHLGKDWEAAGSGHEGINGHLQPPKEAAELLTVWHVRGNCAV